MERVSTSLNTRHTLSTILGCLSIILGYLSIILGCLSEAEDSR